MPDITVSLTATELKCLEYAAASPQDWADNALIELGLLKMRSLLCL